MVVYFRAAGVSQNVSVYSNNEKEIRAQADIKRSNMVGKKYEEHKTKKN